MKAVWPDFKKRSGAPCRRDLLLTGLTRSHGQARQRDNRTKMTAVRVEEVTTPQAFLERTGREWWRSFGTSGNWRRWRCARGVACPVWVVHEGVNGRKGDCPHAIVDPVMEEKVRRRPNDRKHTKINRKRRGGGSHLPSPTLPSTMLWLTRSASARLALFSIRQGGPGTSNIVDGGCKGVCHGNCGRHSANRWDLSVWSRRLTFLSTTGTVHDYKWNRYSTMGCKLPSQ